MPNVNDEVGLTNKRTKKKKTKKRPCWMGGAEWAAFLACTPRARVRASMLAFLGDCFIVSEP